jgi:3-oxoacyl-(acyl-carrier-protein) synthase
MLVLEELEHAKRGARIYAEVADSRPIPTTHVTRPEETTMRIVMELALRDAAIGQVRSAT